jgi:hypothetical protein
MNVIDRIRGNADKIAFVDPILRFGGFIAMHFDRREPIEDG